VIRTPRLILRAPEERDVPRIVEGCSAPDVALCIPAIPNPYSERDAPFADGRTDALRFEPRR